VTNGVLPVLDLEEAELIREVQAGDERALEALYRRHAGRVYALCLRLTADPGRAEELVQDVFLQVWRRIHSFEGRSRFTTWLHRLTLNRALDAMRSDLRRSAREEPVAEPDDRPGKIARLEDGLDLESAIAGLPSGARIVFVLHDVEGYRHDEIATMSGLATGTSKAQLFRARQLLRQRLGR
jgi:RNA polymerase sigma-70 factor, ECF subfamily